MKPEAFQKVRQLFDAAMAQEPGARPAFLRTACPDDEETLAAVEKLIASAGDTELYIDAIRESPIIAPSVTFTTGTKLGTYEILGLLGVGGMGEVYRARDSKLHRDVAIKVLSEAVFSDGERVARFEREARVLAQLNHPHIGAIYDSVEIGESRFLVLELVEGDTLAERIRRRPLSIDEVLLIARQIAEALEAAHEKGIIHRDLKPANIKIDPEGNVKVLDFGLAKVREREDSGGLNSSSTLSGEPGRIMGTVPYMSPEQATGRDADRRSDIWAFGCLLYEMLTGQQAFDGETINDILAAVLKSEPDYDKLPRRTPSTVRRLILRCLQKNRKQRLHDIADGRIAIEEAQNEPPGGIPAVNPYAARERVAWIVASVFAAGIVVLSVLWATQQRPVITVDVVTPQAVDMTEFALSPDGLKLAYVAIENSVSQLWLRTLNDDAGVPEALQGTEGAVFPFFSPDNKWIGFSADGWLKKIHIDGGPVHRLGPHPSVFRGGSWNKNGVIIFGTASGPIYRISDNGDNLSEWTTLQKGKDGSQGSHRFPQFFSDGDSFLFYATASSDELKGVYIGSLKSGDATLILDGKTTRFAAAVVPGTDRVLYVGGAGNTLYSRRLNGSQLDPEAVPVRINLSADPLSYSIGVSASASGSVAYRQGSPCAQRQLQWFNEAGEPGKTVGRPDWECLLNPSVSANRSKATFSAISGGNSEIHLLHLDENRPAEVLTKEEMTDMYSIFSPDSTLIAFAKTLGTGLLDTYIFPILDREKLEVLLPNEPVSINGPLDWHKDGWLLLRRLTQDSWDLFAVPVDERGKAVGPKEEVAATDSEERDGQFSPNGKFVAYQSNEGGESNIWVRPFRPSGVAKQITDTGCAQVRWYPDGEHLACIALDDGALMKISLEFGQDGVSPNMKYQGALFPTNIGGALQATYRQQYAIVEDGKGGVQFLMNVLLDKAREPIHIIRN